MKISSATPPDPDAIVDAQQAIGQRRAVLGPCLAAMGFTENGGPPETLPERLEFEGLGVPLESWERNVLSGLSVGDPELMLAHLAEGIAYRASVQVRLFRLERAASSPQELDGILGEMIEETAVGLALQYEVQRDIDRLVQKGELADAKKLTGFRRKIDQCLAGLKDRISDPAHEQARARSSEMITPRAASPPKRMVAPLPPDIDESLRAPIVEEEPLVEIGVGVPDPTPEYLCAESQRKRELHERRAKPPRPVGRPADPRKRLRSLLLLLVVSSLGYAVFAAMRPSHELPPRLGLEQFRHLEHVLGIKSRPPSLYVTVDARGFESLAEQEQLRLVQELGRIAGKHGYFGVQVKIGAGRTVGQWLRKSGASLVRTALTS